MNMNTYVIVIASKPQISFLMVIWTIIVIISPKVWFVTAIWHKINFLTEFEAFYESIVTFLFMIGAFYSACGSENIKWIKKIVESSNQGWLRYFEVVWKTD